MSNVEAAIETAPLTPTEKRKLTNLGYLATHQAKLHPELAREYITTKRFRPGSAAFNKQQPPELRVNPSQTDEGIEKANKTKAQPSGVKVLIDEFTNACIRGENPMDAVLIDAEAAHPGMRFRLINPDLPQAAGPQFQPAYEEAPDGTRRQIEVAGLKLGFMPETVYNEFYRKPNLERSAQLMGQIKKEDPDTTVDRSEAALVPMEGQGLHIERSSDETLMRLAGVSA
jgi:hypothetical protein